MKKILILISLVLLVSAGRVSAADTNTILATYEIAALAAVNKIVSIVADKVLTLIIPPAVQQPGRAELERLQQLAAADNMTAIDDDLQEFQYDVGPFDGKFLCVLPPWYTAVQKKGNCNAAAWLMAAILPGQIYVIISAIENTTSGGHCIFIDTSGTVWSNFRNDGVFNGDIQELAAEYVSDWRWILRCSASFDVQEIISRG